MWLDKTTAEKEVSYMDVVNQNFKFKCLRCNKGYKNQKVLENHQTKCEGQHIPHTKRSAAYKRAVHLKTKERDTKKPRLSLDGTEIKNTAEFKYLGNMINPQQNLQQTVKHRLELAKTTHKRLYKLLRSLNRDYQRKLTKAITISIALYGCVSWPINEVQSQNQSLLSLPQKLLKPRLQI